MTSTSPLEYTTKPATCAEYNFGPASGRDGIVFSCERPGAADACNEVGAVPDSAVETWARFMHGKGVRRVLVLLDANELEYYASPLLELYARLGFTVAGHVPMGEPDAPHRVMSALRAAEASGERIVFHCTHGMGRCGRVCAAWLAVRYQLSSEEATREAMSAAVANSTVRLGDPAKLQAWLGSSSALPSAVVINLPQHTQRLEAIRARLAAAGVGFERVAAVDGRRMSAAEREADLTPLARRLITPGMAGCFLSHRRCWRRCLHSATPLLVLEDDAVLNAGFGASLGAALAELAQLDPQWDVLLVGAMGMVHPKGWRAYGANVLVGLVAGTIRSPQVLSPRLHVPARPMCTHAYVLSPSGAAKFLAECPRANFHVDVAAWGVRSLRLYCTSPLLATQAAGGDSTIGGGADRRWVPSFTIDSYTGAEFRWVFNGPVLQLGGLLLTVGRSVFSSALLILLALATRSAPLGWAAAGWVGLQLGLINALKVQPRGYVVLNRHAWPRESAAAHAREKNA